MNSEKEQARRTSVERKKAHKEAKAAKALARDQAEKRAFFSQQAETAKSPKSREIAVVIQEQTRKVSKKNAISLATGLKNPPSGVEMVNFYRFSKILSPQEAERAMQVAKVKDQELQEATIRSQEAKRMVSDLPSSSSDSSEGSQTDKVEFLLQNVEIHMKNQSISCQSCMVQH